MCQGALIEGVAQCKAVLFILPAPNKPSSPDSYVTCLQSYNDLGSKPVERLKQRTEYQKEPFALSNLLTAVILPSCSGWHCHTDEHLGRRLHIDGDVIESVLGCYTVNFNPRLIIHLEARLGLKTTKSDTFHSGSFGCSYTWLMIVS